MVDAKSLYDHVNSLSSAASKVKDKLTSVDLTILKEIEYATGIRTRWCPSNLQMSDALTKDAAEPALRLRAAMRDGLYQIQEEGRCMMQRKTERERKEEQKRRNLAAQQKPPEIVFVSPL